MAAQAENSNWLAVLLKASEFADGSLGEGPNPSPCYTAYREALLEPSKITDDDIKALLTKATPEGKLYAACLSYYACTARKQLTDRDRDLKHLLSDQSKVYYRSGCRGTQSTVGDVVGALLKEKHFLNFELEDLSVIEKTAGIPDSILKLAQAKRLENNIVGEGSQSVMYAWFKEASHLPIKAQGKEIAWLMKNGSPAGRLYACFLAIKLDSQAGIEKFRQLVDDNSKVQYQSGCEVEDFTVGSIARQVVEKQKYSLTFLGRQSKSKNRIQ